MEASEGPSAAVNQTYRGVTPSTYRTFKVMADYDTSTGELSRLYYPYGENGYKIRALPKAFYAAGKKNGKLFGQGVVKSNVLVIVEGEQDCLAAFQMLQASNPTIPPAVVSLPNGSASHNAIVDNHDWIMTHKRIVLCLDNDAPGADATKKVNDLLEGRAAIANLGSLKDASEYLEAGKTASFVQAINEAKCRVPDGILTVEDVYEEAIKMPEWGRLYPWKSLNKLTYGRRNGEGIYVGAGTKIGKTEWLSQMVHFITEVEGKKVLLFKFEQSGGDTVKALAGKYKNKRFNIPDGNFTKEELIEGVEMVKGKVMMFNAYMNGTDNSVPLWDRMKPVIRHAVINEGVEDIFIDPITQLTDGMTAADTDVELRRFANQIAGMALELGFFYYCFCHLKSPAQGKTHEEGGNVKVAQFRGSRAMMEKTKYALGITRDMYADDEDERNTSQFHLLLASGVGRTGKFDVYYDIENGSYLERDEKEDVPF